MEITEITTYFTIDNGGVPFKVVINNEKEVKIYSNYKNELLLELSVENENDIFIGKSLLNEMTALSGSYGSQFNGNSILIKIKEKKYLFIGWKIFTFETNYPIILFLSPVGNNDVPYPYAIDEKGNNYLLIENIIISKKLKEGDIYEYYYKNQKLQVSDEKQVYDKRQVNEIYVETYDGYSILSYSSEPNKMYDRMINNDYYKSRINFSSLTKEKFIKMCDDHSNKMGFVKLEIKVIINR